MLRVAGDLVRYRTRQRHDLTEDNEIRPRIWADGTPKREFEFQGPEEHGVANLVQLFGFESPGLTSCLAIAQHVGRMLGLQGRQS